MNARGHVDALTGIRGIVAWLVVLYHIRAGFAPALPAPLVEAAGYGYLAVDLFFVLSGFVLWMTWGERLRRGGWRATLPFLQKRIARIWPLHAVILAATVAFALVIMAAGKPLPESYKWHELPLHVLLVQNWGFTPEIAWNDPSWSISTELAAYLLFAALVPLIRPPRGAAGPLIAIVVLAAALDRFFALHGEARLGADIAFFGLARCLAQFGCGAAMCMIWQAAEPARFRIATGIATVALFAAWFGGARETLVVPLAFVALVGFVAATSRMPANPLSSRVAVVLGDISYSTYLSHFLLWQVFKLLFVADAAAIPLWQGAAFLALTLIASVVLYRLVEVPARDVLSRPGLFAGTRAAA
jgi:peptidoglycan/LPS O-acetylase OafA/YrhL